MIVKCQHSITTTESAPQMLIYDKARKWQWSGGVTPEWADLFKQFGLRFFANVKVFKDGRAPEFVRKVVDLDWPPATREEIVTGLRRLAEYGPYWSCAAGADLLEADAAEIAALRTLVRLKDKSIAEKDAEIARLRAVIAVQHDARNVLAGDINMTAVKRAEELEALVREAIEHNVGYHGHRSWYEAAQSLLKDGVAK